MDFRFFVSESWILDSNPLWDSGFLELYSRFPKSRIPDSTSKNFTDPGIWIQLHGARHALGTGHYLSPGGGREGAEDLGLNKGKFSQTPL